MAIVALQDELQNMVPPLPTTDWAAAVDHVDNLKEFKNIVDQFASDTSKWRSKFKAQFSTGLQNMESEYAGIPKRKVVLELFPALDEILKNLDNSIIATGIPLHQEPKMEEKINEAISLIARNQARFMRKQFRRIEDIRVLQHNVYVDMKYGLLAFKSEYDPEVDIGDSFDDAESLGKFLRAETV